jgi:hypothetical protein
VRDRAGRLLRARTELGFELGRDPGAAKLARYLDWETAEVAEVLSLPADADSLGRPLMLPQGDSSLVGDLVRNPHAEDPSDRASLRAELSRLRNEIRRLHSRQREALTLRHGLGERSGEAGTMRERERPWASAPPRPPTTRSACSWCYGITSRRQAFGSSRGAAGRLRPVPHLAPFPKATLGVARQPYSDNQITK